MAFYETLWSRHIPRLVFSHFRGVKKCMTRFKRLRGQCYFTLHRHFRQWKVFIKKYSFLIFNCFYLNNIIRLFYIPTNFPPASLPIPSPFVSKPLPHLLTPTPTPLPSPLREGQASHGFAQSRAHQVEAGPSSISYIEAGSGNSAWEQVSKSQQSPR